MQTAGCCHNRSGERVLQIKSCIVKSLNQKITQKIGQLIIRSGLGYRPLDEGIRYIDLPRKVCLGFFFYSPTILFKSISSSISCSMIRRLFIFLSQFSAMIPCDLDSNSIVFTNTQGTPPLVANEWPLLCLTNLFSTCLVWPL